MSKLCFVLTIGMGVTSCRASFHNLEEKANAADISGEVQSETSQNDFESEVVIDSTTLPVSDDVFEKEYAEKDDDIKKNPDDDGCVGNHKDDDDGCGNHNDDDGCGNHNDDDGCGNHNDDDGCGNHNDDDGCGNHNDDDGCGNHDDDDDGCHSCEHPSPPHNGPICQGNIRGGDIRLLVDNGNGLKVMEPYRTRVPCNDIQVECGNFKVNHCLNKSQCVYFACEYRDAYDQNWHPLTEPRSYVLISSFP